MREKELEERVMLDRKQFLEIEKYIRDNFSHAKIIHQKNRYFDDDKHTIESIGNMLRIRSFPKNKEREFTYKIKGENGDIEINQILSHYWFYEITRKSHLPDGPVKEQLIKDGVDISNLKMLVELYTRRLEVELDDHRLILDANLYNDISDYNLEIESNISKRHAKEVIMHYCNMFKIEYKEGYVTKVARAFKSIKK